MATVRVTGGQVVIDPPVDTPIQADILAAYKRAPSPAEFLRSLAREFSGSYLRARVVSEPEPPNGHAR